MKILKFILFPFIIYISCCEVCVAQDSYNSWIQYLMSAKLADKSALVALVDYRSYDLGGDPRLFLVSTYLNYEIYKGVKVAPGFMFLILEPYDNNKSTRYEVRPFQQITLTNNIGSFNIIHRFRIEERFLNHPNKFTPRLRYLLSLKVPFNKANERELLYGIFKNEIRLNAVKNDVFDSDWLTAGLGVKLNNKSAIEVSYVCDLEIGKPSNYICIGYRNNFDWRKK